MRCKLSSNTTHYAETSGMRRGGTKRRRTADPPIVVPPALHEELVPKWWPSYDMEEAALESDVMHAIRALQREFYGCKEGSTDGSLSTMAAPVLWHQLYSFISNRTAVDKELQQLQGNNAVRIFKTSSIDYAIVPTEPYLKLAESSLPADAACVFRLVLLSSAGLSVEIEKFKLVCDDATMDVQGIVDAATRAGFLLPRRDIENAYWISHPFIGMLSRDLYKGRAELLRAISRSKYKELRENDLRKKKLKLSCKNGLGFEFVLRDLLGLGKIERFCIPSGTFLRIPC